MPPRLLQVAQTRGQPIADLWLPAVIAQQTEVDLRGPVPLAAAFEFACLDLVTIGGFRSRCARSPTGDQHQCESSPYPSVRHVILGPLGDGLCDFTLNGAPPSNCIGDRYGHDTLILGWPPSSFRRASTMPRLPVLTMTMLLSVANAAAAGDQRSIRQDAP